MASCSTSNADYNWQNKIVNWCMLQSEHGWQAQNQHSNLYVHGEDVSRAIDFINYYFNAAGNNNNNNNRVYKVLSHDQHVYSFRDYSPSKHSLIIWEHFNPEEFSKTELHQMLTSGVLSSKRYLHACSRHTFKSCMLFVSSRGVAQSVAKLTANQHARIWHKLATVEIQPFFGSIFYSDMCLRHIDNELLEYDHETKKKFMKYWFDHVVDFHIEFSSDCISSGEYLNAVKRRFKYHVEN